MVQWTKRSPINSNEGYLLKYNDLRFLECGQVVANGIMIHWFEMQPVRSVGCGAVCAHKTVDDPKCERKSIALMPTAVANALSMHVRNELIETTAETAAVARKMAIPNQFHTNCLHIAHLKRFMSIDLGLFLFQ